MQGFFARGESVNKDQQRQAAAETPLLADGRVTAQRTTKGSLSGSQPCSHQVGVLGVIWAPHPLRKM